MIIIVGLGNPGEKYINTRHNIGFNVVDEIAKGNKFPEFKLSKKFNALISKEANLVLVKPQTFMNLSGKSVKAISSFYKPKELIVVQDDIDLKIGEIKIVKNRGSAGHKGIESIIKELGTKDFTRVRVGIQPEKGKPENIEKFVLQRFEEKEIIKKVVEEIKKAQLC